MMPVINPMTLYYATWVLAGVSLIGTYLNIKKHRTCFIIWGFTNALWVFYDTSIGALAQAALMFCYFVLAVHGFYEWKKGNKMNYVKVFEGCKSDKGAVALV
jgi:nicotinamide riboside transporter PnuC